MERESIMFVGEEIPIKTKPKNLTKSKKQELERLIKEIESNPLTSEQDALTSLKIEYAGYPEIDPSFLSMSSTIKGHDIQVPRFGVFRAKYNVGNEINGFYPFVVEFGSWDIAVLFSTDKSRRASVDFRYFDGHGQAKPFDKLELTNHLVKATEFSRSKETKMKGYFRPSYIFSNIPKEIFMKYTEMGLQTQFSGLIPTKTKEKISEAEKTFLGDDNVYLIAETKPEEWQEVRIKADPLLVGIHQGKTFLVDHFDTTPMEDYVRREFLK